MLETKWFYNGTKMQDGTLISVGAKGDVQIQECLKKGFISIDNYNGEFGKLVKGKIVKEEVKAIVEKVVVKPDPEKNIVKSKKTKKNG